MIAQSRHEEQPAGASLRPRYAFIDAEVYAPADALRQASAALNLITDLLGTKPETVSLSTSNVTGLAVILTAIGNVMDDVASEIEGEHESAARGAAVYPRLGPEPPPDEAAPPRAAETMRS